MAKTAKAKKQYYKEKTILHEKLDEKGIKYHALGLYKFGRTICVDCPYTNKRILIQNCKSCKNFLGSTTKMKNHWLCKKENKDE